MQRLIIGSACQTPDRAKRSNPANKHRGPASFKNFLTPFLRTNTRPMT